MGDDTIKTEDYTSLKEFRVDIDVAKGEEENDAERKFSVCFWIYLVKSSSVSYPTPIINQLQVGSDGDFVAPFLFLNERRIMMLRLLCPVRKDSPPHTDSASLLETPHASMATEFPLEKWVHVGCEVSATVLHLHINGENLVELCFPLPSMTQSNSDGLKTITLVGPSIDNCLQGYVHDVQVSHTSSSVRDCYFKDPPLQLCIDKSSTIEIEEDNDGIWSIVGGKASCRRIFSLDVVLLNAINQSINKELEVISSLIYADNGLPVEKTSDDEAPLLTSFDGIEFPSCDRTSKLLNGRTSFKLKISQLSSKCENRLFYIKFELLKYKGYRFLEAFCHPIRCISRNRYPRPLSATLRRPTSTQYSLSVCPSIASDNGSLELQNSLHEGDVTPSSKKFKLVDEQTSSAPQTEEEHHSQGFAANQAEAMELVEEGNSPSELDSTEERISDYNIESKTQYSIPDPMIFKYCLGSLTDRALLMKEVSTSASDEELFRFADKVSLYSGCAHHRNSIVIGKKLIEEGTRLWNSITQQNHPARWENIAFEIEKQFMKIASCSTRSLVEQDYDLLRRIAGCREYMAQENFEKMWCWLYPVACTLSRGWVNSLWKCSSPKWIEGFITKEEAELSLRGARGLQEPGTFILRFPTSRCWPHPDSGGLVVTYVGSDYSIHHRLLSSEYINSNERQRSAKQVQEMILAEPELCRLGRTIRG